MVTQAFFAKFLHFLTFGVKLAGNSFAERLNQ